MKRRKLLFIALLLALPLALLVSLRATRSWQPRVLELPHHVYTDATEFFWRDNGLIVAKYTESEKPLSIRNWDGALVPLRSLPAQSAAFDRSGTGAARIYEGGGGAAPVELWDGARGQIRRAATAQLRAHNAGEDYLTYASCVAISPDGARVAWPGLKRGGVLVADARTGRELARFLVPTRDASGPLKERDVLAIAWSADQSQIAIAGLTFVAVIDTNNGTLRRFWRRAECAVTRLAWSPDGKMLALAWGHNFHMTSLPDAKDQPTTETYLWVYEAQSGALCASWSESSNNGFEAQGVTNLDFSPEGAQLAWGTHKGRALVMNPKSGAIEQRFGLQIAPDEPPFNGPIGMGDSLSAQYVAYSPDGRTLALASAYRVVLQRVR